jgi:hypothetical protein
MPVISIPVRRESGDIQYIDILHSFVPKTGGTSVLMFFQGSGCQISFGGSDIDHHNYLASPAVNILKCPSQHFHYAILDLIFNLNSFDYSFSIVRNPIDRIKSNYIWTKPTRAGVLISFDEFVRLAFDAYNLDPYHNQNHIRPQSDFIGPGIKRVYKFESGLNGIISDILKYINISTSMPINVKKYNSSEERMSNGLSSSSIEMTHQTRKMIFKFYEKDYDNFYYGF